MKTLTNDSINELRFRWYSWRKISHIATEQAGKYCPWIGMRGQTPTIESNAKWQAGLSLGRTASYWMGLYNQAYWNQRTQLMAPLPAITATPIFHGILS